MAQYCPIMLLLFCAFASILIANAQHQQQQQQQEPQKSQDQQQAQQQQQQTRQVSASTLQAHLEAIHLQAQRHMGQLNSLVLGAAANATQQQQQQQNSATKFAPVLEALSSVGKAIQQQIGNNANGFVQIVNSGEAANQLATSLKNEYQPIELNSGTAQQQVQNGNFSNINYREQGEQLRQEIVKRAGQLQQIVSSSMELLRNNGDLIVRRLLDQMNVRLDQAKAKADRILSEPATNEVALKGLSTINLGLNNLNTIITNIVTRLDTAAKEHQQHSAIAAAAAASASGSAPAANAAHQQQQQQKINTINAQPLADKLKVNLQQLGQQFQSALNATTGQAYHQLSPFMRQRQQQIQQILASVAAQRQQQQQQQQTNSNLQ